jgi:hypothetical protein
LWSRPSLGENLRAQLVGTSTAHISHVLLELGHEQPQHFRRSGLSSGRNAIKRRTADENRFGAESERLYDIAA